MVDTGVQHRPWITDLQARYDRAMENYCRWRRSETDPYRLAENAEYLRQIDRLRRELTAAKAEPGDLVSRMRLLDNWSDPEETGARYVYETPEGSYRLEQNDVTHVWLVHTPDLALEGPFQTAQEAADWAADDWAETFRDDEA
ncbi:MAG: hypothetical protein VBE63_17710 [Lamprobacter sp.]|uniref:hypothetical protein n=1 Tax=Lamprobacter sp. TaxID=3100796 RepID=UPI002B263464|nr:hypothetical protein [Lamprobacter sp.]MEA3641753.1 hypothetical protein [Lamprobacter sp.]